MLNILELQKQLTAVALPSGFEAPQARLLMELARPLADEVWTDAIGNLYCHKKGPGKRMMFAAHMDVIGLMITFVDDKGYLRFEPIGGHAPAGLIGLTVRMESGAKTPPPTFISTATAMWTFTTCSSMWAWRPGPRPRSWRPWARCACLIMNRRRPWAAPC